MIVDFPDLEGHAMKVDSVRFAEEMIRCYPTKVLLDELERRGEDFVFAQYLNKADCRYRFAGDPFRTEILCRKLITEIEKSNEASSAVLN